MDLSPLSAKKAHLSGLAADLIATLRQRAIAAAETAYAPYSHFRIGAAILLENGEIFTGCNVENSSYGLTNCAERTALFSAVSRHGGAVRLRAVAVANLNNAPSAPCGACRQVLLEFSTPEMWVFFPGPDGDAEIQFSQLLPFGFQLAQE
jgi:cytidine deaminase